METIDIEKNDIVMKDGDVELQSLKSDDVIQNESVRRRHEDVNDLTDLMENENERIFSEKDESLEELREPGMSEVARDELMNEDCMMKIEGTREDDSRMQLEQNFRNLKRGLDDSESEADDQDTKRGKWYEGACVQNFEDEDDAKMMDAMNQMQDDDDLNDYDDEMDDAVEKVEKKRMTKTDINTMTKLKLIMSKPKQITLNLIKEVVTQGIHEYENQKILNEEINWCADQKQISSNQWRLQKSNHEVKSRDPKCTEKLIEAEYPGARKEIPAWETMNKYGIAARKKEIGHYRSYSAIETIWRHEIPKGAEIAEGRFAHTTKSKPVESVQLMTDSHVDTQRKLDARLRAKGFAETILNNCSAPTVSINTLRTIYAISPIKKWDFRVIDISRAYLQAFDLERALYMKPPQGAEDNPEKMWRVKKPLYGLCDSTKNWYNTMGAFLKGIGARVSIADPAMYYWSQHGEKMYTEKDTCKNWQEFDTRKMPRDIKEEIKVGVVYGVCTVHVDDLMMFGHQSFLKWMTEAIIKRFNTKEFSENDCKYLGMQITREKNGAIVLDTQGYEDQIHEVEISHSRKKDEESMLTVDEEADFRANLGKLMWIARLTRPDVAFEAAACAQKYKDGEVLYQSYSDQSCGVDSTKKITDIRREIDETYDLLEETADDTKHMKGFQAEQKLETNRVNLFKPKKPLPEETHLKVKNAVYLNKAIRKLHSRRGLTIRFTDVAQGDISDIRVNVHCDASLMNVEAKRSQIGICAMITSKSEEASFPQNSFRKPDIQRARVMVKNKPFIDAVPVMWG